METKPEFRPDPRLKLMDHVHQVMRYRHYAYRTERTYCGWILRYIKFHGAKTHPKEMGKKEVEAFLSHLATHGRVGAGTLAPCARPIMDHIEPVRAKRSRRPAAGSHDPAGSPAGFQPDAGHPFAKCKSPA